MKCTAKRRDGTPCTCQKHVRLIGGVAACEFHWASTRRLWDHVRDAIPADARRAADRDTIQRNLYDALARRDS